MKLNLRILLAAAVLTGGLPSAVAATGETTLPFEVDFARFRMNDHVALVEVYIAVARNRLQFVAADEKLLASFESRVTVAVGDSEVIDYRWVEHTIAADSAEIRPSQVLCTQAGFQLPVNSYNVTVSVSDPRSGRSGTRSFRLVVEPYAAGQLALSDLEVASRIMRDTTRSRFYKNNHTVIPNPGRTYGAAMAMLYTYAEIYNLTFPSDSTYSVRYRVLDDQGREIKTLPVRHRPVNGRQLVEVGGFNVMALSAGAYVLEVEVTDHASRQKATGRQRFYVYREEVRPQPQISAQAAGYDYLLNLYREVPESELDEEFKTMRYLASTDDVKIFSALDVAGKRAFIAKFWQTRDQTPETPQNEFREDYLRRVRFANESFSGLRKGWQTDMGRVLLLYGQPDEVERFPSSSENRPYQIWHYFEIQGGVVFIFVDVSNWGEFRLVHSTARGELSDDDWQRWINPGR
ncbi:MAG: GWxTD domain-containing protein [candidate division KSB1 bacterium]|nr:GWxTD domain-containing protein [candidate division KSB1 bacterium]MDZ7275784.1 GWxTD domain-containing protein [candidate division KSB1 bacterium]MDZ7287536.1 GWxTD domain-containing protein [candidate division KSB1 bacterium]MDZ7307962.1 GWxTD domain-containing protein [candidate division KSB1 bacterium]MDZ7350514.1 GWxTD domain-containing protein [candidate division KSB1 bacterium]